MGSGGNSSAYRRSLRKAKEENECIHSFPTTLQDPQSFALKSVEEGHVLDIKLNETRDKLQAINQLGEVCGFITSPVISKIIECIIKGNQYQADVMSLRGDVCKVEFRNWGLL